MKSDITKLIMLYHEKFDGLVQRERVLIAALILVVLFIGWQLLVMDQFTDEQKKRAQQLRTQQQQNSALQLELSAYQQRQQHDPNRKLQAKQQRLQQQIMLQDQQLSQRMKGVISPQKMTHVLEQVFKRNKTLSLLRLDSLNRKPVFEVKPLEKNKNTQVELRLSDTVTETKPLITAAVYRHPVRIEFSGSYINTLDYLKALEDLPWKLYWDEISLTVEEYPKSKISITVFTLSLKKGWLGV